MHKMIDPDLPLPSNTKYRFEECFAKLLLEYFFSNEFETLSLLDKPDLQNKNLDIGIEVTTAVEKNSLELERLYSELEYGLVRNQEKVEHKIKKLGGKISNGVLIHQVRSRTLNNIYNSYKEKLKLINKGSYSLFKKNYIFITDENIIHEAEILKIIKDLNDIQNDMKYKFDKVYIYIFGNNLYELDLKKEKFKTIYLNKNETYKISCEARKLVEQKEMEIINN